MTPKELIDLISGEDFDFNDYQPLETDSVQQAGDKLAFLQSVADLKETEELRQAPGSIICVVNCVTYYIACGNNAPCWLLFNSCLGNCRQ